MISRVKVTWPPDVIDTCWATDGKQISGSSVSEISGGCTHIYPHYGDPRTTAGAPAADDILKCTLKTLKATGYAQLLTVAQVNRLRAIFPAGLCDYSKPGVGQQQISAAWQFHETTALVQKQTDTARLS